MKLCHWEDDSETSTRTIRQNASEVELYHTCFIQNHKEIEGKSMSFRKKKGISKI